MLNENTCIEISQKKHENTQYAITLKIYENKILLYLYSFKFV
jgi:hypothetical protein